MPGLWVYCVCSKCNVENNLSLARCNVVSEDTVKLLAPFATSEICA